MVSGVVLVSRVPTVPTVTANQCRPFPAGDDPYVTML